MSIIARHAASSAVADLDGAGEFALKTPRFHSFVSGRGPPPGEVLELDFEDVDTLSEFTCALELSCALLIDDLREPLDSLERVALSSAAEPPAAVRSRSAGRSVRVEAASPTMALERPSITSQTTS